LPVIGGANNGDGFHNYQIQLSAKARSDYLAITRKQSYAPNPIGRILTLPP